MEIQEKDVWEQWRTEMYKFDGTDFCREIKKFSNDFLFILLWLMQTHSVYLMDQDYLMDQEIWPEPDP